MRPRHADTLKDFGYDGDVEEFRSILVEVKQELFPDWTDESLIFTRDEAGNYCAAVRKRCNAPRLTRPFILKCLVGVRKHRKRKSKVLTPEATNGARQDSETSATAAD